MSDKLPEIYGYCPAGCKYPTVHKEVFEKSAAYIPVPETYRAEGGWPWYHELEIGKTYKFTSGISYVGDRLIYIIEPQIKYTKFSNGQTLQGNFSVNGIDAEHKYATNVKVILYEVKQGTPTDQDFTIYYEINGKFGSKVFTGAQFNYAYLYCLNNVYLINEEATLTAEKGDKGEKGEKGDSGDIASQEILDEIQREIIYTQKETKKEIDGIYALFNATVTGTEEVTQNYSARQTANGLNGLIDGVLTRVTKIQGSTIATETGLQNAFFKSIESVGKNLIPYPYKDSTVTKYGVTFTDNGDGSITVNGTNTYSSFIIFRLLYGKFCEIPSVTATISGGSSKVEVLSRIQKATGEKATWLQSIKGNSSSGILKIGEKLCELSLVVRAGVTVENETIYPMLNVGETALPYEPYKVDKTFTLDSEVELAEYDYIDIENQQIVRQTATLTQDTAFTEEELIGYGEYVLSLDGKTIVYKSNTATFEEISIPSKYSVWANGIETVTTNNNGATLKITNTYVIKRGAE